MQAAFDSVFPPHRPPLGFCNLPKIALWATRKVACTVGSATYHTCAFVCNKINTCLFARNVREHRDTEGAGGRNPAVRSAPRVNPDFMATFVEQLNKENKAIERINRDRQARGHAPIPTVYYSSDMVAQNIKNNAGFDALGLMPIQTEALSEISEDSLSNTIANFVISNRAFHKLVTNDHEVQAEIVRSAVEPIVQRKVQERAREEYAANALRDAQARLDRVLAPAKNEADACTVKFRTANGNKERCFRHNDSVQNIVDFIHVEGYPPAEYELRVGYPPALLDADMNKTIQQLAQSLGSGDKQLNINVSEK